MQFINVLTGEYPVTEDFIRKEYKNVSFPEPFSPIEPYRTVVDVYRPSYDPMTHELVEIYPIETEKGWIRNWEVRELPIDIVEKKKQELYEQKAALIRQQRSMLLYQTDYTQVADSPVEKQSWADYRQALRDVTNQEGFPFNVIWPEQPA